MQLINISFILLIIATVLIVVLMRYALSFKPVSQIQKLFVLVLASAFIICIRTYSAENMLYDISSCPHKF